MEFRIHRLAMALGTLYQELDNLGLATDSQVLVGNKGQDLVDTQAEDQSIDSFVPSIAQD